MKMRKMKYSANLNETQSKDHLDVVFNALETKLFACLIT